MSEQTEWHLSKSVRIGELIAFSLIVVGAFNWLNSQLNMQDKQVGLNALGLQRLESAVSTHTGSGPHAEASIRLTILETQMLDLSSKVEKVSRGQGKSQDFLREILERLGHRSFSPPGG